MPGLTKVWFDIETLDLLSDIESIVGVKDSSGDLDYFQRLCGLKKKRPDWSILIGPESKLSEAMAAGADGGVNGGANIFPALFVKWYHALAAQDQATAAACRQQVNTLHQIYDVGKYASRHIKATKSALSILEICNDLPADPFHAFLAPERAKVEAILCEVQTP